MFSQWYRWNTLCWQANEHADIFINRRIECYLNNTINLRPLGPHITLCYTRIATIDSMTSLHPMYKLYLLTYLLTPLVSWVTWHAALVADWRGMFRARCRRPVFFRYRRRRAGQPSGLPSPERSRWLTTRSKWRPPGPAHARQSRGSTGHSFLDPIRPDPRIDPTRGQLCASQAAVSLQKRGLIGSLVGLQGGRKRPRFSSMQLFSRIRYDTIRDATF